MLICTALFLYGKALSPSSVAADVSSDYFRGRSLKKMKRFSCAGLALVLALTAFSTRAAAAGGGIHGTVTDPLGAVVAGAQVELFREGKLASTTTTDAEGKYQ